MRKYPWIIIPSILLFQFANAQQKWNLRSIVDYAMSNNINVRLTDMQAKNAALTLQQSKLSQYPNANFNGSWSYNSGSNQDPVSFSRITESYWSSGLQLQSSADIFNFYSKKYTIAGNQLEYDAALANTEKLKYDIALSAANAYLQILLAIEQEKIARIQIEQTSAQLTNTRKMVRAGTLPELNATQLEAQLAMDSVTLVNAKGAVQQNILNLKNFMSLDAGESFEVETPPVESIPLLPLADLMPEVVYNTALANQPTQKFNELKLKAAEKFKDAAWANRLPTFSLFGSLGTGYNSRVQHITGVTPINAPIGNVTVNNINYDVYSLQPLNNYHYAKSGFGTQIKDNFRQSVGLSVSVPIFSGGQLRTNYERQKLNIESLELQKKSDDLKLKQDIYSAYTAAMIALEKYNASKKALTSSETTFDFAQRRYNVGMLGTFDLVTAQNNLLRAKLEVAANHFDYVFKMKVLEFYRGAGLIL